MVNVGGASVKVLTDGRGRAEGRMRRLHGRARHHDPDQTIMLQFDDGGTDRSRRSALQRRTFLSELAREQAALTTWAAAVRWPPACRPATLNVVVSDDFKISRSLVPAWHGHAGRMEFPCWRVLAGKAAIMHELVHVHYPNANRLLAEGLALYLQAEIGGNPAFPNFGRPLHALARAVLTKMAPRARFGHDRLAQVRLGDLDAIATPSPLVLTVGRTRYDEDPAGQAHIYPLAGSFVQFLVERHGWTMFRRLYEQTPLLPGQCHAGAETRWSSAYGSSLEELEITWKAWIAGRPARPTSTPRGRAVMSRSRDGVTCEIIGRRTSGMD